MFKFGVKVAIAGSAVYYLAEQGVWKNSDEAHKVYGKINSAVCPYIKQVTSQVPIEIPELPSRNQVSYLTKHYWNQGVLTTFKFLSELPQTINGYVKKGIEKASENPEIKNFINSISGNQSPPSVEK